MPGQKTKRNLKRFILRSPLMSRAAKRLTRHLPRVFMYHRFSAEPDRLARKMDRKTFAWQLRQLKSGWNTLTLDAYLRNRRNNSDLRYCVILTVDDGYHDFFEVAFPLLKSYDMPATFFVTVNFVDQKTWLWHDRIWHALTHTPKSPEKFKFGNYTFTIQLTGRDALQETWSRMSDFCTGISDKEKWAFIKSLEDFLGIDCPVAPIPEFSAVTWEQLRQMQSSHIEIGSHSLNHPILTKVARKDLIAEIVESKTKLERRLDKTVNTFCYPNGRSSDFDPVAVNTLKQAGYRGAVTTEPPKAKDFDDYRIPRYGIGGDRTDFLWKLYGFEYLSATQYRM